MRTIPFSQAAVVIAVLTFAYHAAAADPLPRVPATEPAAAAQTILLPNGFRAELIAAEPLVTDRSTMPYDERGLAYVMQLHSFKSTAHA